MSIILFGKRGQIGKEIEAKFDKVDDFYAFNSDQVDFLD